MRMMKNRSVMCIITIIFSKMNAGTNTSTVPGEIVFTKKACITSTGFVFEGRPELFQQNGRLLHARGVTDIGVLLSTEL